MKATQRASPTRGPRFTRDLLVVATSTALLGLVGLGYPFGRDQGYYAFVADAVLHGMRMYRDVPMMQMPLTVFVHLVALVLFGHSMLSIRILDLVWTAGTAVLLYVFVRSMFRRRGLALLVGLLFPFLYYIFNWWDTAQVDGFLNLPATGAFALAALAVNRSASAPAPKARPHWFFAGLLVCVALLFKYTVILILPAVFLVPLLSWGWRSSKTRHALLWLSLGAGAGLAAFLAVVTLSGALPGLIEGQMRGVLPYARLERIQQPLWGRVLSLFRVFTVESDRDYLYGVILAALGLLPAAAILLRRGPEADWQAKNAVAVTLAWLGAGLASVLVQNKFFYYHYQSVVPALAVLGSMALVSVMGPLWRVMLRSWQRALLIALGLLAALVNTAYLDRYLVVGRAAFGVQSLRDYWIRRPVQRNDLNVGEQLALADYLAKHTRSDERVVNYGLDPWVVFPAWRKPVFRYTSPFLVPNCTLTTSFRHDPPEVFLVKHGDRLPCVYGTELDSYEQLLEFAQLRNFLLENYELETRVGRFDVLRLVGPSDRCPTGAGPELLASDLDEAKSFVAQAARATHKTLLWPAAPLPNLPGVGAERMLMHRDLNRLLWVNSQLTLAEFLPALSVWIRGDDRPFAQLEPLCFQSDGEHFVTNGYRFSLLHTCRQGQVLIYEVGVRTGAEEVGP